MNPRALLLVAFARGEERGKKEHKFGLRLDTVILKLLKDETRATEEMDQLAQQIRSRQSVCIELSEWKALCLTDQLRVDVRGPITGQNGRTKYAD